MSNYTGKLVSRTEAILSSGARATLHSGDNQDRVGLTCAICGDPMWQGRTSRPQGEAKHNKCRAGVNGGHGNQSAYKRGCRCRICKDGQRDRMRVYVAKKLAEDGVTPSARSRRDARGRAGVVVPPCFICGEPLKMVARGLKRPMHKSCRSYAPNWLRYDLPNPKIEAFRLKIEKAARGTSGGKRIYTAGNCAWCGEHFVRAGARWCSFRCRDSARYAAKSTISFRISPVARAAIYERDGWTCQLCFQPVDPALHYSDRWAASLDHIIPQSLQIVPDHSPDALRLAHKWCNSARGAGTNMDEQVLIARAVAHLEEAS